MTIHVACDECGKGYRIPDEKAGRKVRCRQCEAVIRIPDLKEDYDEYGYEDDSYEDEYEAPAPKRGKSTIRKRGKSKSNGNTGLIIGASAVGALLLIGVTAAFMMSGDDDNAAEPGESVAAADPAEPDESVAPADPAEPDESVAPADPAEPDESVAAADPAEPDESVAAADPAESDLIRKLSVTLDPKILALARIKRSPFCKRSSYSEYMAGRARAIKDGGNTILVGSVPADHAVPWTKPDDLVYRSDFPAPGHPGGFDAGYFCFADSSVRWVERDIIPEKFRGLLTARGGEPVDKLYPQTRTGVPELTPEMLTRRSRDSGNLKRIGIAMMNYQETFRHYPVVFLLGPDGKPWHSWRVLLLYALGEEALFKEYDMTVPWNHSKNLELLDQMPDVYADPFADNPSRTHTKYVEITGSETAFPRTFGLYPGTRQRFDAEVKKLFDSQGLPVPTWVEQYIHNPLESE
jgi:predicted Zn finger-like uncharacterized protein